MIQKEFTIKEDMKSDAFKLLENEISKTNAVSLHIRRGDYCKPENKVLFELLKDDYYKKAIAAIQSQTTDPVFYVFSDDLDWVKSNFTFLNEYRFMNEEKKLKDYEELMLMSTCQHQVMANSTFSWWAAWLNVNEKKIVIQPEKWYTDPVLQDQYSRHNFLYSKNFTRL